MTPEQWAREAMESAVKCGGLTAAIAETIRGAISEERAEYVRRAVEARERSASR